MSHSWNTFVSVILSWCAIADVKITFPDDPEADIKEIRELIDDSAKKRSPGVGTYCSVQDFNTLIISNQLAYINNLVLTVDEQ